VKRFLLALPLVAACGGTPQNINASVEEIAKALSRPAGISALTWDAADLREGSGCVFVLTENRGHQGMTILERREGELARVYISPSWNGAKADKISITDMGHDGKKEVEIILDNGRRIYYLHDGKGYAEEDVLKYHGMTGHGRYRDDVFYRDLDGDGVEEALVVYGHDFSSSPFGAYKWRHGWTEFENSYLEEARREYELSAKSGMDALALGDKKREIRKNLLDYAQK